MGIQRGTRQSMQNIFRLRLRICVHLFAVMVGPGSLFLYVHTCLSNILCRIVSAYRCKCCRTYHVHELSAVRFGLGIQDTLDKWRSYNLCKIFSAANRSPGHTFKSPCPEMLNSHSCSTPSKQHNTIRRGMRVRSAQFAYVFSNIRCGIRVLKTLN